MVDRSSVRSIASSPGFHGQPGLCRSFCTVTVTHRGRLWLSSLKFRGRKASLQKKDAGRPTLEGGGTGKFAKCRPTPNFSAYRGNLIGSACDPFYFRFWHQTEIADLS